MFRKKSGTRHVHILLLPSLFAPHACRAHACRAHTQGSSIINQSREEHNVKLVLWVKIEAVCRVRRCLCEEEEEEEGDRKQRIWCENEACSSFRGILMGHCTPTQCLSAQLQALDFIFTLNIFKSLKEFVHISIC